MPRLAATFPIAIAAVAAAMFILLGREALPGSEEAPAAYGARLLERGVLAAEALRDRSFPKVAEAIVSAKARKQHEQEPSFGKRQDTLKQSTARSESEIDAQQQVSVKRYREALEQQEIEGAGAELVIPEQPDEVRLRMPPVDRTGPEMRCDVPIPSESTLVTRDVKIHVKAIFQEDYGHEVAWKYNIRFENLGVETVQMLTRHWVFINDAGVVENEVKGPGARGVTPVLPPGGEWSYESGTSLSTKKGSMLGSFQFEVLSGRGSASERSFSARVARLSLTKDGKARMVPCASEASDDMLPPTGVLAIERVIAGATVDFVGKKDGKFEFKYDVQINNARDGPVNVVGHRWELVDATGKKHAVADGVGVGGVYQSKSKALPAGEAFRTRGTLLSPTAEANLQGTYYVELRVDGEKVEIEARTDYMGCSTDEGAARVRNFVVDPKFR